ncbi:MAG: hypothetical protein ACK4FS_01930 [Flavobacterium sp.]
MGVAVAVAVWFTVAVCGGLVLGGGIWSRSFGMEFGIWDLVFGI